MEFKADPWVKLRRYMIVVTAPAMRQLMLPCKTRQMMERIHEEFPNPKFGNYHPPINRYG
ncbi:MAG TPA: hypothetical protein VF145_02975 [Chitinophagaceae bacterium]